jgi:hypothetical protein
MLVVMFFMLLFHGSSLLLMFFGLGILGQLCAELSLIVWFERGEDLLLLLSFSFHLEVVIVSVCLAYLPSIYFGSLTRLLRPLRPRHLLRTCPGTQQIAQLCGKQSFFFNCEQTSVLAARQIDSDRFSPNSTGAPSDCHLNIPS